MRKAILGAAALAALLFTGPAWAKDPCISNCDLTANQLQGQHQGQQQTLVNQNNVKVNGGAGGQGGQGGLGGQGGVGGTAAATSNSGGNKMISNYNSTPGAYAPDTIASPPGLAGSIGFGVCATQDSASGGGGVGVGVPFGPSLGVSGSYGATTTNENLQCDYGRTVEAVCKLNPNFLIGGKRAGDICGHVMSKLAGVSEALAEIDQEDLQVAKQQNAIRSTTGWGHCDPDPVHAGKSLCYDGNGKRTN